MNANRNLKITLYRGNKVDHVMQDPNNRHAKPHNNTRFATKSKRR